MADQKKPEPFYTRPPKMGKWEGFKVFLWNSETHQFLGRTGPSWGKIILFYLIFYAALIGFFASLLAIFYQTLDVKSPKWKLNKSLIGTNPGLGFRPMPPDENVESTLVWYESSNPKNVKYWRTELDKFLKAYDKKENPHAGNIVDCDAGIPPQEGQVCDVNMDSWYPCVPRAQYNFNDSIGGPCIFLKLNKIFDWVPHYYNTSKSLPTDAPPSLKEYVEAIENTPNRQAELKTVWVTCEGENPADLENIGPLNFYPMQGFGGQYFPFYNTEGYLSPLVAVHFSKPARGVLINIECKAWASNIEFNRADRRGSVHFELMVDY